MISSKSRISQVNSNPLFVVQVSTRHLFFAVSDNIDLDDAKEASSAAANTGVSALLQALARPVPGMASVQFVLGNSRGDGENGTASDFQLNTCTVHKSGALVIESTQSNKDLFDASQDALLPLMSTIDLPQQLSSSFAHSATPSRRVSFVSPSEGGATPLSGGVCCPADDSDSDSGEGVPASPGAKDEKPAAAATGTPGFSMTLRRRSMTNSLTIHSEGGLYGDDDDIVVEEWALLDPHTCTVALHPFRKAKTYRTLEELNAAAAAALKRAARSGGAGQDGCFRVRAPFFEEFDYLYDREMRRRRSALAQRRREQSQPIALPDGAESDPIKVLAREAAVIAQPQALNALIGEDPYEVADLPPPQVPQQQDGVDGDNDGLNDYDGGNGVTEFSDSDSDEDVAGGGLGGLDDQAQGYYNAVLSSRNEEFYSERYRKEMELNARISMWRSKLDPILEEQQKRKGYNIQECATDILNALDEKTGGDEGDDGERGNVKFAELVAGKETWEVSRFFLASLLLINCGNIAVHKQDPLEFSVKSTELSFSAVQNYERLQEGQNESEGKKGGGGKGKRKRKLGDENGNENNDDDDDDDAEVLTSEPMTKRTRRK